MTSSVHLFLSTSSHSPPQLFFSSQACPVPLRFDYYFWNVTNAQAVSFRSLLLIIFDFYSLGFPRATALSPVDEGWTTKNSLSNSGTLFFLVVSFLKTKNPTPVAPGRAARARRGRALRFQGERERVLKRAGMRHRERREEKARVFYLDHSTTAEAEETQKKTKSKKNPPAGPRAPLERQLLRRQVRGHL